MRLGREWSVAALAVAIAGCGLIPPQANPMLPGTQWRVTAVDGEAVVGTEVIVTVLADAVTVSTSCGASIGDIVKNEGQSFEVAPLEGPGAGPMCPPAALRTHERVAEALATVDRWAPAGDATELVGEHTVRIQPQHTDS